MAAGLFGRAIVQSGALDLDEPDMAGADAIGLAMTRRVAGAEASGRAADLARLRAMPAGQLLRMPGQRADTMPFVDGRMVAQPMREGFSRGAAGRIDLLIGRNSDEAGFFPPGFHARVPALFGSEWPAVRKLADPAGHYGEAWAARQVAGDLFAGTGTRAVAAAASAGGGAVYQYLFDVATPEARARGEGAVHTADLPYVFGTLPPASGAQAAGVAHRIGDLWTSFAKTGVPAAPGVPEWPRYDGQRRVMVIGDGAFVVRKDPAADRLEFLDRPRAWHVN
jgi:para-nitrobenzyl esterase